MAGSTEIVGNSRRGKGTGKGRAKGTPNKLNAELKTMIREALDDLGGKKYLVKQGTENPQAFLTLLGKLIPSEVKAAISHEDRVIQLSGSLIVQSLEEAKDIIVEAGEQESLPD